MRRRSNELTVYMTLSGCRCGDVRSPGQSRYSRTRTRSFSNTTLYLSGSVSVGSLAIAAEPYTGRCPNRLVAARNRPLRQRCSLCAHYESLDRLAMPTQVQGAPQQTGLVVRAEPFADEKFPASSLGLHPCSHVDCVAKCGEIADRAADVAHVRDPGVDRNPDREPRARRLPVTDGPQQVGPRIVGLSAILRS